MVHHKDHSDDRGDGADQEIQDDVETRGEGEVDRQVFVGQRQKSESQIVEDLFFEFSFCVTESFKGIERKLSQNDALPAIVNLIVGDCECDSSWYHVCEIALISWKNFKDLSRIIIHLENIFEEEWLDCHLKDGCAGEHLEPSVIRLPLRDPLIVDALNEGIFAEVSCWLQTEGVLIHPHSFIEGYQGAGLMLLHQ